MKWTDTPDIAIALVREASRTRTRRRCTSSTCYKWVLALPGFDDDPKRCGEKILEAIQMAWIDEAE